jgi:hypothetical protein
MDSRTFLGLESAHNPFRWKLPVTPGISTTGGFLFGGSGLAAAISAMEGTSERHRPSCLAPTTARRGRRTRIWPARSTNGSTSVW